MQTDQLKAHQEEEASLWSACMTHSLAYGLAGFMVKTSLHGV